MSRISKQRWEAIRSRGKLRFFTYEMATVAMIPTIATLLVCGAEFLWTGRFEVSRSLLAQAIIGTCIFLWRGYFSAHRDWESGEDAYGHSAPTDRADG